MTTRAVKKRHKPVRAPKRLKKPSVAPLKKIGYPSDTAIQPAWIGREFPEYVEDRGMSHELSSVRTAEHRGRKIEIKTTYEIKVDGRPVYVHAIVGDDGRLLCHSTPYVRYQSAIELVKTLLDRFPEAFAEGDGGHEGHGEHGEGEGHDGHRGGER